MADGQRDYLQGVIEFYQTRTDTKMTIAAERLAVIAAVTLPITALSSVLGMNVIVNDHDRWWARWSCSWPSCSSCPRSCWSGPRARAGGEPMGADDRLLRPDHPRLPASPALFVIDVDGTLLTSTHEVSAATAREVDRVRRRGVEVLLASSRGAGAMRPVVDALGLTDGAAFVGSQGGLTAGYDGDGVLRVLDRCPAPVAAARAVVAAATAEGLAVGWYAAERVAGLARRPDHRRGRRGVVHDTPEVADLLTEAAEPDKLLVIAPPGRDPEVLRALAAALPPELTAQISNPTYLEVTRRGVDKAVGRRALVRPPGHPAGRRGGDRRRPERPGPVRRSPAPPSRRRTPARRSPPRRP